MEKNRKIRKFKKNNKIIKNNKKIKKMKLSSYSTKYSFSFN